MSDTPLPQPLGIPKDVLTDLVETNARLLNAPDLPDAAITAAAKAVHDLSCRCDWAPGMSSRHHLPHDMELELGGSEALARVVLEAAAPALYAQGAATERARLESHITALENALHAHDPYHDLLDGDDG